MMNKHTINAPIFWRGLSLIAFIEESQLGTMVKVASTDSSQPWYALTRLKLGLEHDDVPPLKNTHSRVKIV